MKFKVEENLPREVCFLLRNAGHDAFSVLDQALSGTGDPRVFEICRNERRILVTLDVDFAHIQAYPPGQRLESW